MASFNSLGDLLYSVGNSLLNGALKRILTGAGLGLVTYASLSTLLEKLILDANTKLQEGDGEILSIIGLSGADTALSMVLSACIIRVTIYSTQVRVIRQD